MRIVTWNVNSVRLRLEQLARIEEALRPDVLCLQEIKVADPLFPHDPFALLGYEHRAVLGMKSYNGVAILSKRPLSGISAQHWCEREDCRHLIATVDGVELHCLYVPAGGDLPDPEVNPKFAHKLAFLDALSAWFAGQDPAKPRVLLGDLNIAPLETDVWSHKQMVRVVSHTPVEVGRLARLQASLAWHDAVRHFIPPSEKLYSWWSYRAADWQKADRGRRLDHIWVTPPLIGALKEATIYKDSRGWLPPSDHVPVLAEIAV